MHPRRLRCSSLKYSRYSRSSRLAGGAPRPSRCDARLSPRAARPCARPVPQGCRERSSACFGLAAYGVFEISVVPALSRFSSPCSPNWAATKTRNHEMNSAELTFEGRTKAGSAGRRPLGITARNHKPVPRTDRLWFRGVISSGAPQRGACAPSFVLSWPTCDTETPIALRIRTSKAPLSTGHRFAGTVNRASKFPPKMRAASSALVPSASTIRLCSS